MSRAAVTSNLGARAAQAGPSRIRHLAQSTTPTTSRPTPPPPRELPKPTQYPRVPPGIVQIPHAALDPSLGSTKLFVKILNTGMPSLVHIYAVSRAIETHLKNSVVAVDLPMNPELVVPQTAFYVTLLRPVKLEQRVSVITRQPKITAKDTDLYGPSFEDIRGVLDSTVEVEEVHGEPGPLASLGDTDKLVFNMAPSEKDYNPTPLNQQPFGKIPKRLYDARVRMRQEKVAEDMKIYAVVEQLARTSHGEFDEVLTKFRRLKPAPGPDAERVARELALLRHRELAEAAPIPGWAFTLDEGSPGAPTPTKGGEPVAPAEGRKPVERTRPATPRAGGFSLSALSEAPVAESSVDEAPRSETTLEPTPPPASTGSSTIPKSRSTTRSTGHATSSSTLDTSRTPGTPHQTPSQPSPTDSRIKQSGKDRELELARQRARQRAEAEAQEEERQLLEREEKEMQRVVEQERKEREQREAERGPGALESIGKTFRGLGERLGLRR